MFVLKVWWIKVKLDLTCWAFLLSVVALRRFSAPSLIFSSLRISLRIFSRCSSRSCCTPESEKSEFWSRPSCSRTDSPPGSLWMNKEETTMKSWEGEKAGQTGNSGKEIAWTGKDVKRSGNSSKHYETNKTEWRFSFTTDCLNADDSGTVGK